MSSILDTNNKYKFNVCVVYTFSELAISLLRQVPPFLQYKCAAVRSSMSFPSCLRPARHSQNIRESVLRPVFVIPFWFCSLRDVFRRGACELGATCCQHHHHQSHVLLLLLSPCAVRVRKKKKKRVFYFMHHS